jgi:hypothetical protein
VLAVEPEQVRSADDRLGRVGEQTRCDWIARPVPRLRSVRFEVEAVAIAAGRRWLATLPERQQRATLRVALGAWLRRGEPLRQARPSLEPGASHEGIDVDG